MQHISLALMIILGFIFGTPTSAADKAGDILKAVVKIRAQVPEDAATASLLGTEREGNGVLIDSNGHILTIGYIILEAESIDVISSENDVVEADFVGYDYDTGFGLLRAKKTINATPMDLGQSSELKEGDPVLIAGHGGSKAVSGARVISRGAFTGYWEYLIDKAIFTAPPYSNYAGAALIAPDGTLLGIGSIFTQVAVRGFGVVQSNMFVPIDLLKPILSDLKTIGRSRLSQKPWLGVHTEESHGRVFVIRILQGGPAERAKLQIGDLILKVNGKAVNGQADFYRKVWALGAAGVKVPMSILRGTEIQDLDLQSTDRYQFLKPPARKTIKRENL
ncbi:MAG: S1C family serine protease [Desulfobacterales bacterium]|jgi:S1-C subfamily serine protease